MNTQRQTQPKAAHAPTPSFAPVRGRLLQRKCACGGAPGVDGECQACRQKRLQRQAVRQAAPTSAPPIVHDVLRSPGQPLDLATRAFMEPRFGHDFSQVRVHTDARAAESAQAVNALAYTVGRDVVFGAGQYGPTQGAGKHLLAHELAHVVQQRTQAVRLSPKIIAMAPADALEQEAQTAATAIVHDQQPNLSSNSLPSLARAPAPTPVCPSGTKTVSIDLISLNGSSHDPYPDVTRANQIFAPACVQLKVLVGKSVVPALSDKWLGGDTDLQIGTCGKASSEELQAYNGTTNAFGLTGRLRAFYVATISSGSRGDSYPPYCATGTAAPLSGMISVTNSGATRTLAHEVGHILINSGDHPADTANLMHPTNTATDEQLTAAQRAAIYANA